MAQLSGTVKSSGKPLAGVLVKLAAKSTNTDRQGKYRFTGLSTGKKQVTFSKNGYQTLTVTKTVTVFGTTLNVTMVPVVVPAPVNVTFLGVTWDMPMVSMGGISWS